jgi:hypothetical protein
VATPWPLPVVYLSLGVCCRSMWTQGKSTPWALTRTYEALKANGKLREVGPSGVDTHKRRVNADVRKLTPQALTRANEGVRSRERHCRHKGSRPLAVDVRKRGEALPVVGTAEGTPGIEPGSWGRKNRGVGTRGKDDAGRRREMAKRGPA